MSGIYIAGSARFKRDWTICSKYANRYKFNNQHDWGMGYGCLGSFYIYISNNLWFTIVVVVNNLKTVTKRI